MGKAVSIIPANALAGRIGREKMMMTRSAYALDLDGLSVAETALMPVELAADALAHIEQAGALLLAADMCGGAYACIDYTLDYLKTRKQFGKLIGSYQALKHSIVDAHQAYEKARSHLYSAAHVFGEQGEGDIAVHMAKAEAGGLIPCVLTAPFSFMAVSSTIACAALSPRPLWGARFMAMRAITAQIAALMF